MTINCIHCQSPQTVKNGISYHGHQRYLCRNCKRTFGLHNHRRINDNLREQALSLYAEGMGLRAIERVLGVSHNSVMNWVRLEVAGKALERVDAADIHTVEVDELWSFVGQKIATSGCGGLLIVLPKELSDGRWAVVQPAQAGSWLRKFLAALYTLTPLTTSDATERSFPKSSLSKVRRTPTPLKASTSD